MIFHSLQSHVKFNWIKSSCIILLAPVQNLTEIRDYYNYGRFTKVQYFIGLLFIVFYGFCWRGCVSWWSKSRWRIWIVCTIWARYTLWMLGNGDVLTFLCLLFTCNWKIDKKIRVNAWKFLQLKVFSEVFLI